MESGDNELSRIVTLQQQKAGDGEGSSGSGQPQ
jgi:hypothetical protein